MIALLAPLFAGALAPLGERLQCADAPPPGAVRVADLVASPALLREVLDRHARYRGVAGNDLRAVASAWVLDYAEVLLPPVVAAASALHHVFPVSADSIWLQTDRGGNPVCFHIRQTGVARPGADTAERYAPLLEGHLAPLFQALVRLTRVAPKILWGNTSRNLEPILDQVLAATGGAAPITEDKAHLLGEPAWPTCDGQALRDNPLFGRQREVREIFEEKPVSFRLHRQCCLYYLLPHETHCNACPLSPAHRKGEEESELEQPSA
ncbi:siderophore-iron reductase FhuF [Variovorax ginsengisoli]|uniref:Ferric iron reductase protein FhuF n=1 Tax=Variovorax ginsengisoli TaxID=363844 RepID=A0ABT9S9X4_9BURK|nr:siderophore-iron reductase FhuF [Variovorax ginsengisoli]MDP9900694.1 ferric iron reductase protein FhuF [Variovorax ginsengisoli]